MRSLVLALVSCLLAWPAAAHEIGKTQVRASFSADDTYRIDITIDPDALLTRLQILSSGTARVPANRRERDLEIASLASTYSSAVHLRFDGTEVQPRFEYRPAAALADLAQEPAIVRLSGATPAGARAFTLAYDLAAGTFALVAHVHDSVAQTFWLEGSHESRPIPLVGLQPPAARGEVAREYFTLGFTHILPKGLDHILFVLGLFLLSARTAPVLAQVSTFPLAHTITLALTVYGVVSLPARLVEPLIAVSIAYVAIENVVTAELKSWRVALVFSFGLLHGMGFAGVLRDLGLPRHEFLTALVTFNLGVEAGQLTVVAAALLLVGYWRSRACEYRRFVVQPASLAIAATGLYWTVQRLL